MQTRTNRCRKVIRDTLPTGFVVRGLVPRYYLFQQDSQCVGLFHVIVYSNRIRSAWACPTLLSVLKT